MAEALEAAGALVRRAIEAETSEELHAQGRARILATAVSSRFPARRRKSWLPLSLAAEAAVLLAVGVFSYRRPLGYAVEGATSLESNYLGAPAHRPAEVRFDDGSRIRAEAGTRLRIDESFRDRARVLVERGSATAHVQHGKSTNWTFVAGPFTVHVTGTRFTLSWEPVSEEVELTLHEGSVEVEGPLTRGRIAVRAGQRLRASVPQGSLHVDALAPAAPAAVAPAAQKAAASASEPAPAVASAAPEPDADGAREPQRTPWPDLVRRGEFSAVVQEARRRGIEASLSGSSAAELRALADAARYAGESALAERALSAIRDRFRGGREAAKAAFWLGRSRENAGDTAAADRFYATYLREADGGELAADALAGRMRLASTRGNEAARPLALEYLRRYPRGVHASRARQIVDHE